MNAAPPEFDPTRPKWVQIAEVIRARIASGEYPRHHLLSEARLEAEFGVARVTVRKATAALRTEGLIITTPGMGSFVSKQVPDDLVGESRKRERPTNGPHPPN